MTSKGGKRTRPVWDWIAKSLPAAAPQMPQLTLKLHAQPGLCLHHNHQQQIPWTNLTLPPGKPLPPLNPTSLATKTEQWRSHPRRRHRQWKGIGHFRPNPCLEPSTLDRTGRRLRTSRSCLKISICWPSTNLAGCPPSPAAASWKTLSCAWCKSKPPAQTPSTGWADPLAASCSLPKHLRRLLIYSQTGTHPKFEKSTGRWLKTLHSTTPMKFSHRSASCRTRSSVPCGRQPKRQTVKVIGKGDRTLHQHHNIRGKSNPAALIKSESIWHPSAIP